ncbi:hypothetical protein PUV54_13195 [Hyphococcus flavus]|uniref:Uncharacterized protein n=1 Tax=Hyphococcus flavus TaxID=1866326 RepID=A0AAE9ZAR6_9PROT|nr:hypothetical protein [Hyphococcus flavus]WDI30909.1 hypothetical protein PUV54_13195 [Hyphococcus flavus]
MRHLLFTTAAAAFVASASLAAPAPENTAPTARDTVRDAIASRITTPRTNPDGFEVPPTSGDGGWIRMCITELRYIAFTTDYVHSGFAKTPTGDDYYFGVTKSGIIISPSSTPVLVPTSEGFAAPATPDLWSFLRVAANEGKWVEFYAWEPDESGVQRVTQVRRQYPSPETAPCPAS